VGSGEKPPICSPRLQDSGEERSFIQCSRVEHQSAQLCESELELLWGEQEMCSMLLVEHSHNTSSIVDIVVATFDNASVGYIPVVVAHFETLALLHNYSSLASIFAIPDSGLALESVGLHTCP